MESTKTLHLICVAGLIGMGSFIGGLFPKMLKKSKKAKIYLPLVLIFSVGLNLSIAFVDIMPELAIGGHDHDEQSSSSHEHHSEPERLTFFASGLVILALMFIEAVTIGDHSHGDHHDDHHSHENHSHGDHSHSSKIQASSVVSKEESSTLIEKDEENEVFNDHHFKDINNSKSSLSIMITLLSLSIHSFLEGLDFSSHGNSFMHIFCLSLHKFFESIGLGMALFSGVLSFHAAIFYLLFFSCITPTAIFVGKFLIENFKGKEMILKILKGSSLGSLLYVIFIESYSSGFHGKNKYYKHLCSLIGYLMGSIAIFKSH